jgi:hypothetical protein
MEVVRAAGRAPLVVHLFKRKTCECLRCGLRPSPHLVIVFTESVDEYLDLPPGHVQCRRPS